MKSGIGRIGARHVGLAVALTAVVVGALAATAQSADALDPAEVQKKWARRLSGRHFIATVRHSLTGASDRRMTLRWDDSKKRERMLVRMEWPDEMRGRSWLLLENSDRGNEYIVYSTTRASAGPKRIRGLRAENPFPGTDFDYLGLWVAENRHPAPTAVTPDRVGDRSALRLTEEGTDLLFDRREIWLDAKSFVPLRGEYWKDDVRYMVAETKKIKTVQGVETPLRVTFTFPGSESRAEITTTWQIESIDYDRPILESYFRAPR